MWEINFTIAYIVTNIRLFMRWDYFVVAACVIFKCVIFKVPGLVDYFHFYKL